jgi:hypothetical protein
MNYPTAKYHTIQISPHPYLTRSITVLRKDIVLCDALMTDAVGTGAAC